ncbi:MAG: B12-binding domain-containing radical SAM protein [Candidatus Hydrogenedentes bacterium]|nr:B12-binding domain-containing radical SAM protein [Candidatus Hydrogenedentota bacterium]
MKVALINPAVPASLKKENLGLAYLAACLEAAGHRACIVDELAGEDVDAELNRFRPDIVGISFMTMLANRAYAIADRIRRERGLTVVLGGAHATALPEEAFEHGDCVIRGEAELTFPRVLDAGRVEGIVEASPPADLDALPLPRRDLLRLDAYAAEGDELAGLSYRTLGVITSRGCPFHCTFCVNSKRESRLRFHSPERVVEELEYLVDRHRIESVAFYDELMATDGERFEAICERMIERGLNRLKWECQLHTRTVDADTLALMKRAGCVQVAIGFESGSQRILDTVQKHATVEQNLAAARMIREAGLRVRGCFIVGAPGETREDLRATERFIKEARIDFASVHYLTPMPGTVLFDAFADRIAESGIPWEKFTAGDPDTFACNDAMPAGEQKEVFLQLSARLAFRNYSWCDMIRRALREPRRALHVALHAIGKPR